MGKKYIVNQATLYICKLFYNKLSRSKLFDSSSLAQTSAPDVHHKSDCVRRTKCTDREGEKRTVEDDVQRRFRRVSCAILQRRIYDFRQRLPQQTFNFRFEDMQTLRVDRND